MKLWHDVHFAFWRMHVRTIPFKSKVAGFGNQRGTYTPHLWMNPRRERSETRTFWAHSNHSKLAMWAALKICIWSKSELGANFFKSFEVLWINWSFPIKFKILALTSDSTMNISTLSMLFGTCPSLTNVFVSSSLHSLLIQLSKNEHFPFPLKIELVSQPVRK